MKIIVLGGGAAGIFAAVNSAAAEVLVIEKSNKLLAKVKVSGGGRCNVTHAGFDNSELIKNYPRGGKELRAAFSRFTTADIISWFKERGVGLKAEEDGRMFPVTDSSQTIIDCLLHEAEKNNVTIRQGTVVHDVRKEKGKFYLMLSDKQEISCDKLLIATGGYPKLSSYEWIRKLGHSIVAPVPSLFTFNLKDKEIAKLMGISVPEVRISIQNTKLSYEGPLLITHWGFSGPAVLKLSAWGARVLHEMNYSYTVKVSWLPYYTENELKDRLLLLKKNQADSKVANTNNFQFPKRLWDYFIARAGINETTRWADLSNKNMNRLVEVLFNDNYPAEGKTTFKEEFVTCGGVSLKEVDFRTMESKIVPGLFFAGEVLDIDGITGGFNFQAAWTTAWIAAQRISEEPIAKREKL